VIKSKFKDGDQVLYKGRIATILSHVYFRGGFGFYYEIPKTAYETQYVPENSLTKIDANNEQV